MKHGHIMKQQGRVEICQKCGCALHKNGDWWLAGRFSKAEPPCEGEQSEWLKIATLGEEFEN